MKKKKKVSRVKVVLCLTGLLWLMQEQCVMAEENQKEEGITIGEEAEQIRGIGEDDFEQMLEKEANREMEHYLWEQMADYDLQEMEQSYLKLFPGFCVDTDGLFKMIVKGEFFTAGKLFIQAVKEGILGEI